MLPIPHERSPPRSPASPSARPPTPRSRRPHRRRRGGERVTGRGSESVRGRGRDHRPTAGDRGPLAGASRPGGGWAPVPQEGCPIYDEPQHAGPVGGALKGLAASWDRPQLLERFFELSQDLLCVATLDGVFLEVNPAWEPVLRRPREELLGVRYLDLVHPEDLEATAEAAELLARGEHVSGFENRYRRGDGSYRWLSWTSTPSPIDGLVYAVVRDVTEDRRRRAWAEELEQVSGVGTWELDLDTGEVIWSVETFRIYGLEPTPDGRISLGSALVCYPSEAESVLGHALARVQAAGEAYDLELPFRTTQGEERWVRTTGRAYRRGGRTLRIYGSIQDITEQHAQRRELQRSNDLSAEAQEIARLGHWHADKQTGALTWSPMVYRIFGLDERTFEPSVEAFLDAVHPDDRELVRASEERARTTGIQDVVHRIVRPDGEVRAVRERARSRIDEQGQLASLTGTVQDVTDQYRLEVELRHSQAQLRRVLASTRDGWWEYDLAQNRATHSEAWWELHGYEVDALACTPTLWRQLTDPADLPRVDAIFAEAFRSQAPSVDVRASALHRDGTRIPVAVRALVEYDDHGRPVRVSGTTRDIRDLVQADRLKDVFLSTVSHELRTPLSSISGAVELLQAGRGGEITPTSAQLLDVASRNAVRLRRLIDDLLDVERLASGKQRFSFMRVSLAHLLARAVADLRGTAERAQVELELTKSHSPCRDVCADPLRIEQVVINLVGNACRYAPPGTTVQVRCGAVDDEQVRVEVIDQGPGIPEAFQTRVFDRFAQADAADLRSRGGTGLGLPISREIIERHGGQIGFTSRPGRTCFWFTLPTDLMRCSSAG
ncbi:MAG: PAS domain-containing protein [Nitriliruptoraceae bacterium]